MQKLIKIEKVILIPSKHIHILTFICIHTHSRTILSKFRRKPQEESSYKSWQLRGEWKREGKMAMRFELSWHGGQLYGFNRQF